LGSVLEVMEALGSLQEVGEETRWLRTGRLGLTIWKGKRRYIFII